MSFGAGVPAGVTLTATSSLTAPAGAATISSVKRATEAITGAVPFFYVTFSVSANFSSQLISTETVSLLPSDPTTATYGAAFDDITTSPGTELGTAGPGTIASGLVTILNGTSTTAPALQAGHTYLQFFYVPASAGPTASPTATPTASPTASPTATASAGSTFTFTGGSDNTGATSNCNSSACLPLSVPAQPFNTTVTFGVASSPVEIFVALASGANPSSQISPSGSFTYFTGTGTVKEYLQISGSANVTFVQTPSIMLTGLTGVTGCTFYIYTNSGIWAAVSPVTGPATVTNGSVTMPMASGVSGAGVPNGNPVQIGPAAGYGAVVCS